MQIRKTALAILFSLCTLLTVQAQKMWISGIYDHNTLTYYENGKLTDIGTVWNTGGNGPTGQQSNNKHMVAYGEFKQYENSWYFEMEKVQLTHAQRHDGIFEVFPNNDCPIQGMTEGRLVLENGKKIEIAYTGDITPGHYITVGEAEHGTSICDGKRIPTYYVRNISTMSYGRGVRPYYMSNDTRDAAKRNGGAYIQDMSDMLPKENEPSLSHTGSRVSIEEAEAALAVHNRARAEVGAAPLTWSAEISAYAQQWADYLAQNGCMMEHRSSLGKKDRNYGENIFRGYGVVYTAADASESWYSEIEDYVYEPIRRRGTGEPVVGHYTQMVWQNSTAIGMGVAQCANGTYIIVANYDPAGNFIGQHPY